MGVPGFFSWITKNCRSNNILVPINVLNNNKQNNFVDNKEKSGIYSLNKGQLKVLRQDILYFDEKKYVDEEEIAKVKKL